MPRGAQIIIMGIFIALFLNATLFKKDKNLYHGTGFTIAMPAGWEKEEIAANPGIVFVSESKPHSVTFVTPEKHSYVNPYVASVEQIPLASLTIYANKMPQSIWVEDEIGRILEELAKYNTILDRGDVPIGKERASWVVFHDTKNPLVLTIEFYIMTEMNVFYKIIYSAHSDHFSSYREVFEKAKGSFRIGQWRSGLW